MKRVLCTLAVIVGLIGLTLSVVPAGVALAAPQDEVCAGIGGCDSDGSLTDVMRTVVQIFSVIIGITAVIMIMVAGFKYITAGGDSGNITSAKQTIVYAVVGLVVAALAQVIVKFVLNKTT